MEKKSLKKEKIYKHKGPGKPRMKTCPNIVNGEKCEQLSFNRKEHCPKCNYYFFENKPVICRKKSNFENKKENTDNKKINNKKINNKKINKKKKNNIIIYNNITINIPDIKDLDKLKIYLSSLSPYKPHETEGFITPIYKKKLVFQY